MMKKFNASYFFLLGHTLRHHNNMYAGNYVLTAAEKEVVTNSIKNADSIFREYGLSSALTAYDDIQMIMATLSEVNGGHVQAQFDMLLNAVRFDLQRELFLSMPATQASRFELKEPFGPDVAKNFPSATFDSQEAGNCFACGRYTASVYHSMRVLEYGLNGFLQEFPSLRPRTPNWGDILFEIEKAVTNLPRSNPKKDQYLGLVTDFKIFKDAWRNDVSHIGSQYLEDDADSIYRHVGRFMKGLAKNDYKE
jgi:HEPN domain-containing protein